MELEFFSISVPRREALEMYRALMSRHILTCLLRRERGLEEVDVPPLVGVLERTLGLGEEEAHRMFHELEDDLWEYGWYSFTDEWAWHRARMDVLKDLGSKSRTLKDEELERMVEDQYKKSFETYVAEVDMHEISEKPKGKKTKKR